MNGIKFPFCSKKKEKIMNVYEYIAANNPREANYMLSGYGYKKTQSKREISENLKSLVRKNKEEGLKDLADIHPDKDLILSLIEDKVTVSADEQMNFAGVSGQDFVQNLQTNTYWTPNNPKRPISPDFFYNSNGIDENALADKISNQVKSEINSKNNQKEILDTIREVNNQQQIINGNGTVNGNKMELTMTHLVILGSALFIGYMVYSNLKK